MSKLLDFWSDMTGVVLDYAFSTPPSAAWLMCYGQALPAGDAATARLRQKLIDDGFPYGDDGAGNPKVPDARGRTTAGKDNMGGTAANRLTTAGAGVNGAVLGATGGAETHTLTAAQHAAHAHGVTDPGHNHTATDSGHAHTAWQDDHSHGGVPAIMHANAGGYGLYDGAGKGYTDRGVVIPSSVAGLTYGNTGSASAGAVYVASGASNIAVASKATSITVQDQGSGQAHNNTQPTLVLNKIIKL